MREILIAVAVPCSLLTTNLIILFIFIEVSEEMIFLFFCTVLSNIKVGSTLIPSFTIVAVTEARCMGVIEIP